MDSPGGPVSRHLQTDTALGYQGSAEGHPAFPTSLGVPYGDAEEMANLGRPLEDGDPTHPARYLKNYLVCAECAAKAEYPEPVVSEGAVISVLTAPGDGPWEPPSPPVH